MNYIVYERQPYTGVLLNVLCKCASKELALDYMKGAAEAWAAYQMSLFVEQKKPAEVPDYTAEYGRIKARAELYFDVVPEDSQHYPVWFKEETMREVTAPLEDTGWEIWKKLGDAADRDSAIEFMRSVKYNPKYAIRTRAKRKTDR